MTPPISPGPAAAATAASCAYSTPASFMARSMMPSSISTWARAAISGTTPPKAACSSVCERTMLDRIRPDPSSLALDHGGGGFIAGGLNSQNQHGRRVIQFEPLHWCPASEVRNPPLRPLIRTSEASGAPIALILPVPLFDLKFLTELATSAVGTSNRRHWTKAAFGYPPEASSIARPRSEIIRCCRIAAGGSVAHGRSRHPSAAQRRGHRGLPARAGI